SAMSWARWPSDVGGSTLAGDRHPAQGLDSGGAEALDAAKLLQGAEGAPPIAILHDPPPQSRADPRKGLEFLQRGLVEVHREAEQEPGGAPRFGDRPPLPLVRAEQEGKFAAGALPGHHPPLL